MIELAKLASNTYSDAAMNEMKSRVVSTHQERRLSCRGQTQKCKVAVWRCNIDKIIGSDSSNLKTWILLRSSLVVSSSWKPKRKGISAWHCHRRKNIFHYDNPKCRKVWRYPSPASMSMAKLFTDGII